MIIHKNEEGSLRVCAQVLVLHLILVTPPSSMITQQDDTNTAAQNEYGDKGPVQTHSVCVCGGGSHNLGFALLHSQGCLGGRWAVTTLSLTTKSPPSCGCNHRRTQAYIQLSKLGLRWVLVTSVT